MNSKLSLIFADRGAPIELTGEGEIRRAIETGLLAKDTWVTFVDGDKSGRVRASEAPGVGEFFADPETKPAEVSVAKPPPVAKHTGVERPKSSPAIAQEAKTSHVREGDDPKPSDLSQTVVPVYERNGSSGGGILIIAGVGILAVIALVAAISNGNGQGSNSSNYLPTSIDSSAPPEIDNRPIQRLYAARVVSVRRSASRDGAKVGDARRDEAFDGVLVSNAENEQWLEIKTGRWAGGFVWIGNLRESQRPVLTPLSIQLMASYYTEVYKEPNASSGYLGAPALQTGERVTGVGYTSDGWTEITLEGFGVGYVQSTSLQRWEEFDEGSEDGSASEEDNCIGSTSAGCGQPSTFNAPDRNSTSRGFSAKPGASLPGVLTNPTWSRPPAPEFPERAQSRGIESGSVTLDCEVQSNGSVSSCSILSEDPAGAGFGQAALAGARLARLSPRQVDGVAVGGKVRFTTRFRLASEPANPLY